MGKVLREKQSVSVWTYVASTSFKRPKSRPAIAWAFHASKLDPLSTSRQISYGMVCLEVRLRNG